MSKPPPADLTEALTSLRRTLAFDSRDWAKDRADAWLYALLCGWGCEEDHQHDDICGGDTALEEVAHLHGWNEETVDRARRLRRAIAAQSPKE